MDENRQDMVENRIKAVLADRWKSLSKVTPYGYFESDPFELFKVTPHGHSKVTPSGLLKMTPPAGRPVLVG